MDAVRTSEARRLGGFGAGWRGLYGGGSGAEEAVGEPSVGGTRGVMRRPKSLATCDEKG